MPVTALARASLRSRVDIFCFRRRTDGRLGASWCTHRIRGSRSQRQNLTFAVHLTALRSPSSFLCVSSSPVSCSPHGDSPNSQPPIHPTPLPFRSFPLLLLSHVMREKRCWVDFFYIVITKRSVGKKICGWWRRTKVWLSYTTICEIRFLFLN